MGLLWKANLWSLPVHSQGGFKAGQFTLPHPEQEREARCDLAVQALIIKNPRANLACLWKDTQETGNTAFLQGGEQGSWAKGMGGTLSFSVLDSFVPF